MIQPAEKPADIHPSRTVQDYLMTMHVMERDQGEIVAARLAESLGVSQATVATTLKRMERDGWISGKSRLAGVSLTETGREAARSVTRRHMLTEWLLLKVLKVPMIEIHNEAHHIEHAISPRLEERLIDILGAPQTCPHGNPFPGYESVTSAWVALSAIQAGRRIIIRRLHEAVEDNAELLEYLILNGLTPGEEALVSAVLPFNQTLTLRVGECEVVLGYPSAQGIFVEVA